MRIILFAICAALIPALTSCYFHKTPEEATNYRLTPAQLEWQIYRLGDEMQFGNAKSAKVRRYRITRVTDTLEEYSVVGPLGGGTLYYYQRITAKLQRTDSVEYLRNCLNGSCDSSRLTHVALNLSIRESQFDKKPVADHYATWPSARTYNLPIDLPVAEWADNSYLNYRPQIKLGNQTFTDVLLYTYTGPGFNSPRYKTVRTLYVTKQHGVVGFEEDGTGLWYRL